MRFVVDTDHHRIERPDGSSVSWFDAGRDLLASWWLAASWATRESYGVRWRGRPVIQLPGDLLALHELIHRLRPTAIVETGVAHGGSLLFHAAQLLLLHPPDDPGAARPRVIGVDLSIRPANRTAIAADRLGAIVELVEGDSAAPDTVEAVRSRLRRGDRVLVILDAAHTRAHVAAELAGLAPLVTPGSAIVVMDTILPELAELPGGSPSWREDHPAAAIAAFLASPAGRQFAVDLTAPHAPTHFPGGILLRDDEAPS